MKKLHKCLLSEIKVGEFPLHHDCVLKVEYFPSCGVRFEHFTCMLKDSAEMVSILNQISLIRKISISRIDDFCE